MRRYREKALHSQGVTPEPRAVRPNEVPALVIALADKKDKLIKINAQLQAKHLGHAVRYGVFGPTFDELSPLLT